MVVKPPRERPKPWRRVPLSTRCLMVRADDGAVDHLQGIWHCPALVQGLQDVLAEARECPAPELSVDARPFAELGRQVSPWYAGAGDPENAIKDEAMVGRPAPVRVTDSTNEMFKEHPFLVRHEVSCQAGLLRRYQHES